MRQTKKTTLTSCSRRKDVESRGFEGGDGTQRRRHGLIGGSLHLIQQREHLWVLALALHGPHLNVVLQQAAEDAVQTFHQI